MVHVLACLAEGWGIRATARVFEVDPKTVLHWLGEAAEQLKAFSASFLCNVHVNQLQLDELYALRCGKVDIESLECLKPTRPCPMLSSSIKEVGDGEHQVVGTSW
jgi:hypothetical protein